MRTFGSNYQRTNTQIIIRVSKGFKIWMDEFAERDKDTAKSRWHNEGKTQWITNV